MAFAIERPADIADFPQWVWIHPNVWTSPTFRDTVKSWLVTFLATHSWAYLWEVEEQKKPDRATSIYDNPVIVVRITHRSDPKGPGQDPELTVLEVSQDFTAEAYEPGAALTAKLDQIRVSLEALADLLP